VIDFNLGPIGERINSAGSDLSLGGSTSRKGSASSLSSAEGVRGETSGDARERRRRANSRARNGAIARSMKGNNSHSSSERGIGSAGSDSDSSLSSTLKGTGTPQSLNATLSSTLKAGDVGDRTPRANTTSDQADRSGLHVDLTLSQLDRDDSVTYEQLQSMVETVLVECGYYSTQTAREQTPPHALPHAALLSDSLRSRRS